MWPFQLKDKSQSVVNKGIINMWLKVVVACIPSAVLGLLLDDILEEYFGGAVSIAIMLIVYGIAFILVESRNKKRSGKNDCLLRKAIKIKKTGILRISRFFFISHSGADIPFHALFLPCLLFPEIRFVYVNII